MKTFLTAAGVTLCLLGTTPPARATTVDDLLSSYRTAGATEFSAETGRALWTKTFNDPKSGETRSCTTCHTEDLRKTGKHAQTGKPIEPMAPSVNPKRLTDAKFIEKWFKRNCTWTLGRECTPQEKGDVLMFLRGQ
jgi:hypothetical protein